MKMPLKITSSNITILATILLFISLYGTGSAMFDSFFSMQVFLNLFVDNAFLIIVATGLAFVIVTGGIDLSVASLIALVSVLSAVMLRAGIHPFVVMPSVLLLGTIFGLLQGYLICRFHIHPWIVTLGGMFLARGTCFLISPESIVIDNPIYSAISNFRIPLPGDGSISIGVVVALVTVAAAVYVSRYTAFGRNVYAIGGNEKSAELMGLPVYVTKLAVYTLSGFCSALSGIVFTFYMLSGYGLHLMGGEMDAIAACVIGGILLTGGFGYFVGPMLGVLSAGVIQTMIMFQGSLSSWWTKIVIGFLLFAFIALQRAIVSRRERKRNPHNPKKTKSTVQNVVQL
ncbi:sugar ABC transporter permease YjfF [Paenibacillus sp. CGMCC 1.16610]|uniref:Galactofuranose ABC transporter, permease protein YjfF n=3 Tax=Paenibacillus TaxID=44249 RepID=A0ABU3RE45_9BACL|nr:MULTISPECIES: galactofuranose ABC transporter, permease protein YjfF [Paenibacillus]MBA2936751.1 sugar ABC transporter permease YjfF [Paenibacillus sp. CGMCC 1.16610]MCY9658812.1 sugar ABC transporter permease YjfF [Paenibacillus anseongense]MDU0202534.1 galactofuranose ABC transporter, permease protein YjfF [Paenibacillus sp. PFR10]MEB4792810.1 sugar ABC transporter permease YjfF [Paenibacillus chondroitinus]MEC0269009.1 sugar ABC transporter permease YjfF [Paenibacillus anseongense]